MLKRKSRFVLVAILAVAATVGAGVGLLAFYAPGWFAKEEKAPPYQHIATGGTSVAYIIMENRWKTSYRDKAGLVVDYTSTGSTGGVEGVIKGDYAIGFSHAPMTEEQRTKAKKQGGEVVQVPVLLCAVVPIYNVKKLQSKSPLKFTGEVLADIYLGKIEWWDDDAIKDLQGKDVELPHTKITVVHRKESSGTTLIFTDYLRDASERWRAKFPEAKSDIDWPVGEGKERSQGVAEFVNKTDGAIGYVDLLIAFRGELDKGDNPETRKIQFGAVQNKDKEFIHAESQNIAAAAEQAIAKSSEDSKLDVVNMAGKESYPICGVVWAIAYRDQPANNQKHVVDFLRWVTHDGQKFAKGMSFAPLPEALVKRIDKNLDQIKTQ